MNATALIVDIDRSRLLERRRALESMGIRVSGAESFPQARRLLLEVQPDLVVAPVKLGPYNGLHLALLARDQQPAARVIVTGTADLDVEADATAAGATYLVEPDPAALAAAVRQALAGAGPNRRWIRKPVERRVRGLADGAEVRLVDVSYGGVRLELESARRQALAGGFRLRLPDFDIIAEAFPVWQVADVERGTWMCGAAVAGHDQALGSAWRRFVDSLGELPT